jgi:hypothetical protein
MTRIIFLIRPFTQYLVHVRLEEGAIIGELTLTKLVYSTLLYDVW